MDAESLAFVLRGRPLCRDCLAEHLHASIEDVDDACHSLLVPQKGGRCDGCLKQTIVHWLG